MTTFHYAIIRHVPDPVRGEFRNVGVVIWSPLKASYELTSTLAATHYRDFTDVLDEITANAPASDGHTWLERTLGHYRNIIQFSAPLPMIAPDLQTAHANLMALFVR